MRAFIHLLLGVGLTAPTGALAAAPNRNLSFVAVPTSDAPWVRRTAALVARHAEQRLGLNPEKVHVLERVPRKAKFLKFVRLGKLQAALSQHDLVVFYFVGEKVDDRGIPLADGHLTWTEVAGLQRSIREGPGAFYGNFLAPVLTVVDAPGKMSARPFRRMPDVGLLHLRGAGTVILGDDLPAKTPPLLEQGHAALQALAGDPQALVSGGAPVWVGAIEIAVAQEGGRGDIEHLRDGMRRAKQRVALVRGRAWERDRFRLVRHGVRLDIVTAVPNDATRRMCVAFQGLVEAEAQRLKQRVRARIVASAEHTADVECTLGVFFDKLRLSCTDLGGNKLAEREPEQVNADEAMAAAVSRILGRYERIVGRNWSVKRRSLRPLDVVLLVDTSLSMAYNDPTARTDPELPPGAPSKREVVLVRLAGSLANHAAFIQRPVRLRVAVFGETVDWVPLPGGDQLKTRLAPTQLDAWRAVFVKALRPDRATYISDALRFAASALRRNVHAERHVVLLTDGRESARGRSPEEAAGDVRRAAEAARATGATVHSIGLSELNGRLPGYLRRMRAGGEVARRFVALRPMKFARDKTCWTADDWGRRQARACGRYFADVIARDDGYDRGLLDEIRRSERPGVPSGLFLDADSVKSFQTRLQELVTALTPEGIYVVSDAVRQTNPREPSLVTDSWRLDLDLRTAARVVIYNRDALDNVAWLVRRDNRPVAQGQGYTVEHAGVVTVIRLAKPAQGVWLIRRDGTVQK